MFGSQFNFLIRHNGFNIGTIKLIICSYNFKYFIKSIIIFNNKYKIKLILLYTLMQNEFSLF